MSLHELNTFPGVTAQPDTATTNFVFNHTMLRVKDITQSLDFYTRVLGFSLVEKRDFPEAEFSLYFLALVDKSQIPADAAHNLARLLRARGATRVDVYCLARTPKPEGPR